MSEPDKPEDLSYCPMIGGKPAKTQEECEKLYRERLGDIVSLRVVEGQVQNEGRQNYSEVDLLDLLAWLKENQPDLLLRYITTKLHL